MKQQISISQKGKLTLKMNGRSASALLFRTQLHEYGVYAYEQLFLILFLPHTHKQIQSTVCLPPSAVRQTEGRRDEECSQVARVQAVVCAVISAQVFKELNVHIQTVGEAFIVDQRCEIASILRYFFMCAMDRGN